ncbi:gamma-glutamyltransferase [Longispora albida]|uniref:gamma-glutamyltransferase n=1 Tax=Longispora albida TaxID=203523 RepID=UPI000362FF40|nr:gamma-glutamyltransferase [Longispora albida]
MQQTTPASTRAHLPTPAGIAAGHPATTQAGAQILAAGGSAADAAVAAVLASCVAETILTGLGGGGFATYYDAATGEVTCLDFFCSVPGLGADREPEPMTPISVEFGGVPIPYSAGGPSVGVPGVPAGCGELHRRWGRLDWADVVKPAIELAKAGVPLPEAQAVSLISIAPALLPGEGAAIYAPGGRLLAGGEVLFHPGLAATLSLLAQEGPALFYTGSAAKLAADCVAAGGGVLTEADLAGYTVNAVPVFSTSFAGHTVHARADLNRTIETLARVEHTDPVSVARALEDPLPQKVGDTTNVSVVDGDGNACVVTTTMGIGSGVWLPGMGVHLNSMLGEGELLTPGLGPGGRMSSMMCPLVVTGELPGGGRGLVLAAGSAGASRIRTALLHTLIGVLDRGLSTVDAIARPRFHPAGGVLQAEPGLPDEDLLALAAAGYQMRVWGALDHYFGGASAVGLAGAAGDPRRGGTGILL